MNAEFAHLETSSQDKELESITSVPARYARFGEFCMDLVKQELSKGGVRVKMQGKVCGVLMILLETPGEVVTRKGYTFIAPVEYSDDAPATQQTRKSLLRISSGPESTNGLGEGPHDGDR